jgi:NAD-dependent SIR2 family protein deacetylase
MYERIYELIRKGEVVLFCGAGMSIGAGFPSGNSLAASIYDTLSPGERSQIGSSLSLADLTEAFIDLKLGKRHALVEILKEIFNKEPNSMDLHNRVTQVPQIKTVITTNYDTLFERAYGTAAVTVKENVDVAYIPSEKVQIIKIHGDLSVPDSILICRSDYTRYFDTNVRQLVWTLVKERLSTKTILFMGYSLEDSNIESIFKKISEQLGSNLRECFLLAPSLPKLKIDKLTRMGIHYLDGTAEDFITGLQENIRENINDDLKKRWVDAETYRKVLEQHSLNPKLTAKEGKFVVSGVDGIDQIANGKITFSVNRSNKELIEKVRNLFTKGELSELVLDQDNTVNLSLYLNDIRFPGSPGEQLIIKPAPVASSDIDFLFDNGKEFERIKTEIYKSGENAVFLIYLKTAKLKLTMPFVDLLDISKFSSNVTYSHCAEYQRPNDEIETFEFLHALGSSGGITVHGAKLGSYKLNMPTTAQMVDEAEKYLYYFRSLKTIEKYFKVKFDKIGEITDKTYVVLNNMLALAEDEKLTVRSTDSITITNTDPVTRQQVIDHVTRNEHGGIGMKGEAFETVNLHGQDLQLGYRQTELVEPYIDHLEKVLSDPNFNIEIRSARDERVITFNQNSSPLKKN